MFMMIYLKVSETQTYETIWHTETNIPKIFQNNPN